MENMFREIDKSLGSAYSVVFRDYMNRKNELTRLSGEEFAEKFVETAMVLHELYVAMDMLYAKNIINEVTYNTILKFLENEKKSLSDLLRSRIEPFPSSQ